MKLSLISLLILTSQVLAQNSQGKIESPKKIESIGFLIISRGPDTAEIFKVERNGETYFLLYEYENAMEIKMSCGIPISELKKYKSMDELLQNMSDSVSSMKFNPVGYTRALVKASDVRKLNDEEAAKFAKTKEYRHKKSIK